VSAATRGKGRKRGCGGIDEEKWQWSLPERERQSFSSQEADVQKPSPKQHMMESGDKKKG